MNVMFNRDEQHARTVGGPPAYMERDGIGILAPVDPVGGGTWIASTTTGRVVAVLNHYEAETGDARPGIRKSRGLLVLEAAVAAEVDLAVRGAVGGNAYAPFRLLVIDVSGSAFEWVWDGRKLDAGAEESKKHGFRSTSGERPAEVVAWRQSQFAEVMAAGGGRERRRAFHRLRHSGDDAMSVLMMRDDARTVSLTEVTIDGTQVSMETTLRGRDGVFSEPVGQQIRMSEREVSE